MSAPGGDRSDLPLQAPPLALYVHLPWCVRKCPYCDFNSYQAPDGTLPESAYIDALLTDLRGDLSLTSGRPVATIFFGGGTPSLFAPESFARLLREIGALLAVSPLAEITLEANPGTIERGRFEGYREAGINRVSLGAQSFGAEQLKRLGRIHDPHDTWRAVEELKQAKLANYNLDLMYALPQQTRALASVDLDEALKLGAPHLSYYHLTLEPGTAFHRAPPDLPDEDQADAIEADACARLGAEGYERYEISAWARPGHACQHNLNYWNYGDYLGIGAGAHGKLTLPAGDSILRTVKPGNPAGYLKAAHAPGPKGERTPVPPAQRPFEFMLNTTRLAAGFTQAQFESRTGLAYTRIARTVERLAFRGLLEERGGSVRATALGWRFLTDVQAAFLNS
jgi:oxygen-independent coproporphyrinogen-3 oxidase